MEATRFKRWKELPTMEQKRPDPDALLAQVKAEEAREQRGKLKIFFGAAAGVGKTYTMLQEGRAKYAEGVDVVVGYAEPHCRPETEAVLLGMEILPYKMIEYRGAKLKELDLEAALKRRPELILVDELAHTNAPGMLHTKRWQDVEELLRAGIDVYTSLNVQHLESLNDVVAQITGVIVRETLPDAVFEQADEIELIDLPPDDLLERFKEGKIYVAGQAERAMQSFFRKANLAALRELALRRAADRVNAQVQSARQEQFVRQTWPTADRVLVCITPSPSSAKVIRTAKRIAVATHAEWIAAYVETPKLSRLSDKARDRLLRNVRLAERLGAETVTLSGHNTVDEIINYARSRNVTRIIVGKSDRPRWVNLLFGSFVEELIHRSGEIDVHVVHGGGEKEEPSAEMMPRDELPVDWPQYARATFVVAICTGIVEVMFLLWPSFEPANLVMVYLVGAVVVATRYGRGPAVYAPILSVLALDFFFVNPRFEFAVHDTQYLITLVVMLGVALFISTLTVRIREQAQESRQRERRTEALYRMAGQLAGTAGMGKILEVAVRHVEEVFHSKVALLLPDADGRLTVRAASDSTMGRSIPELAVANWAFDNGQIAGRGTDTLPASEALYLPLIAGRGVIGVMGIVATRTHQLLAPEQRQLLEAFADQISLALERAELAETARQAEVKAETEALRSTLLSSVSHDLRTPLAVITGASSSLLEDDTGVEPPARRDLIQTIYDESNRLARLVGNLLDITRLEAGAVQLSRQLHPLEEIVGSALNRMDKQLEGRKLETSIPGDLPMVSVDGVLIEQVLINLLDNATRYTPPGTAIQVTAKAQDGQVMVEVADNGPGLGPGEEERIFEKFYRGASTGSQRGSGLGLPIARAILAAHGGRIWAENRPAGEGGGAAFRFTLSAEGTPPVRHLSKAAGNHQPDDMRHH